MAPAEYSQVIARFYGIAAKVVDDHDGLLDKFVGDEAVGDTVNVAARLRSMAGAGELVVSAATAEAAAIDTSELERRTLELRGRERTLDVWVMGVACLAGLHRRSSPGGGGRCYPESTGSAIRPAQ
jgi:class 3 adenylate cyclase